jgi:hypothetical protein
MQGAIAHYVACTPTFFERFEGASLVEAQAFVAALRRALAAGLR